MVRKDSAISGFLKCGAQPTLSSSLEATEKDGVGGVGMFPLILTVLDRDCSRGTIIPSKDCSFRANVPTQTVNPNPEPQTPTEPQALNPKALNPNP